MSEFWNQLIIWLSIHAVTPILSFLHIQTIAGNPDDIAEGGLITGVQIAVIVCIFRPLEAFAPAEVWKDRKLTHIDRQYTLIKLLILNPLLAFVALTTLTNSFAGNDVSGTAGPTGGLINIVPALAHHPYLAFACYFIVYDLTYYWMHRLEHIVPWLWALHSLHHSQRQMSCWTDDRDSYLSGLLESLVLSSVGLLIGVDASQFALLLLISELMQNLSHTNTRLGFGRLMEKLFVDPRFHRLHHMRMDTFRPHLHNCNFGLVLSVWDSLFKTALFNEPLRPTGVSDPMVDIDNERGLLTMQWGALQRFWGAFSNVSGWKLGDVSFSPNNRPV